MGGVAANKYICNNFKKIEYNYNCSIVMPTNDMISDNAAMVGWAWIQKSSKKLVADILFKPDPRLVINN